MTDEAITNGPRTPKNEPERAGGVAASPDAPNAPEAVFERPEQEAEKPIEPEVEVVKPERRHISDETLLEVLRASGGFRSVAADRLHISPSAVSKRIARNPMLKAAVEDAEQRMIDMAQNELVKKVRDGNLLAIFFVLKCKGGWTEKHEFKLDGGDMPTPLTFVLPPLSAIQAAQEAKRQIGEQPL